MIGCEIGWEQFLSSISDSNSGKKYKGATGDAPTILSPEGGGGFNQVSTWFQPPHKPRDSTTALRAAEKLAALKGHDFSRAAKSSKMPSALAAEGRFFSSSPFIRTFSATSVAAEEPFSPLPPKTSTFSAASEVAPRLQIDSESHSASARLECALKPETEAPDSFWPCILDVMHAFRRRLSLAFAVFAALSFAHAQRDASPFSSGITAVLPNGREIHPAGNWIPLAPYPFALAVRPDGDTDRRARPSVSRSR